jgi:hypothetical protein
MQAALDLSIAVNGYTFGPEDSGPSLEDVRLKGEELGALLIWFLVTPPAFRAQRGIYSTPFETSFIYQEKQ